MLPPGGSSAEKTASQTPEHIATAIEQFLAEHAEAAVLEDGKVLFDLRTAKFSLSTEHERCTLHLWSEQRNLVRRVVAVTERGGALRLATQRFGQTQTKLLELVRSRERRTPATREAARSLYVPMLERMLERTFPEWKAEGFRAAMDLEKSFGPAYTRGSLARGNQAWAVIGVNADETAMTIDGILTLGVLWLHHCREQSGGRRLYQGLKIVVPRGTATLTLARLAWMNPEAAQWELWELDQSSEEMEPRDAADQGNLRTRLVHHPDPYAAQERFAEAIAQVMQLVPASEAWRVDQRLRNTAELAFELHGLEFARARVGLAANSFAHTLELTVGVGASETPLTAANRVELAEKVAELFARRRHSVPSVDFGRTGSSSSRRIGSAAASRAAHSRLNVGEASRSQLPNSARDPLYRAAPERWLESVLRRDLAPLTRSLAREAVGSSSRRADRFANDPDPDSIGNRSDTVAAGEAYPSTSPSLRSGSGSAQDDNFRGAQDDNFVDGSSRVIPRLDPEHVYAQVPAIAGASDRGLLDLLGVTADGRLAVIELKADDDLHFALQGLDYWIRVRHHHLQAADASTGMGEFQRHGYFRGVELSPLPPRLYLVAPALHIHPATETVLRYFSPRVEWHLLALDERWRQQIRVVWRKQGGRLG
jgi:hypothetical protein